MSNDMPDLPVIHAATADPPSFVDPASIAERIREREQAVRDGAFAYLHNGRDLSMMKRRLGHGAFLPWCETEFKSTLGWSVRTIERMMAAADAVGERIDTLSKMRVPKTTIYAVTSPSTPAPIRSEFLARIEAGDASAASDALAAIKAAKEQTLKDARLAKLSPEAKATEDKREAATLKRRERELAKREAEEAERKAALVEAVAMLKDRLGDDAGAFAALVERAGYFSMTSIAQMLNKAASDPPVVEGEAEGAVLACEADDNDSPAMSALGNVPRRGTASMQRYVGIGPRVREASDAA